MSARLLRRQLRRVPKRWRPATLLATWFGIGLLPWVPGTWASLVALPLAWLLVGLGGSWALGAGLVAVFAVGWWASGAYERETGVHDPSAVVIDEVAAQWLTLILVPADPWLYATGFVLFRIADIAKLWPANVLDRRLTGGLGIMLDDMIAAVYAAAALFLIAQGVA